MHLVSIAIHVPLIVVGEVDGQLVRLVLHHLAVGAPAQSRKGHNDHAPAHDGGPTERLAGQEPIGKGDDEDGQQGGDAGQHGRRQRNQHQEAAAKRGVGQDGQENQPARRGVGDFETLNVEPVQEGEGDPEHGEGEEADAAAEHVGEDGAADGGHTLGRAGVALVQDLVEAVQHGTHADDEVACEAGACTGVGGAGHGRRRLVGAGVAVGYDQDAQDGDHDGDGLVHAEGFFENRHGECVRKEGAAVVYGGQVGRGRQAHGNVPAQPGNGQRRGDVYRHSRKIHDRPPAPGNRGRRDVDGLQLNHGDGRQDNL